MKIPFMRIEHLSKVLAKKSNHMLSNATFCSCPKQWVHISALLGYTLLEYQSGGIVAYLPVDVINLKWDSKDFLAVSWRSAYSRRAKKQVRS